LAKPPDWAPAIELDVPGSDAPAHCVATDGRPAPGIVPDVGKARPDVGGARLGDGIVRIWLSPGVASSVESRGIVPPPPLPAPDVPSPDEAEVPADAPLPQPAWPLEDEAAMPPPSKVVEDEPSGFPPPPVEQGAGLNPGVLSSVAPSGIPPSCGTLPDGAVPRGDVGPIPGVGLSCAKLAPEPINQASAVIAARRIVRKRCIALLIYFFFSRHRANYGKLTRPLSD
jgi:hypothetical protein